MAEENASAGERSQPATSRRLEELKRQGQVPRSSDLGATAVLLSVAATLALAGSYFVDRARELLNNGLGTAIPHGVAPGYLDDPAVFGNALMDGLFAFAGLVLPVLGVAVSAAVLGSVAMGGWTLSAAPLAPDLSKLNPITGLTKRVFTVRGLAEMLKATAKFVLVVLGAALWVRWQLSDFLDLASAAPLDGLSATARHLGYGFLALASTMLVIAAADVPFQRWSFARRHRMSLEDIKRESRNEEGAPELRAKVRAMQREVAQRRMMEAVASADVVVTNPSHYAVALRYDPKASGSAPRVVAAGLDLVSWQIRRRAAQHHVPIVAAPPLARAIYHSTRLGEEIPAGLYAAVAVVLKYAYRLRGDRRYRDAELPPELPIPAELEAD